MSSSIYPRRSCDYEAYDLLLAMDPRQYSSVPANPWTNFLCYDLFDSKLAIDFGSEADAENPAVASQSSENAVAGCDGCKSFDAGFCLCPGIYEGFTQAKLCSQSFQRSSVSVCNVQMAPVSRYLLWASYFLYCLGWLTEILMLLAILLAIPGTTAYFAWFTLKSLGPVFERSDTYRHADEALAHLAFITIYFTIVMWGMAPFLSIESRLTGRAKERISRIVKLLTVIWTASSIRTIFLAWNWSLQLDAAGYIHLAGTCQVMATCLGIVLCAGLVCLSHPSHLADSHSPLTMKQILANTMGMTDIMGSVAAIWA